jgi:hypothetical protein
MKSDSGSSLKHIRMVVGGLGVPVGEITVFTGSRGDKFWVGVCSGSGFSPGVAEHEARNILIATKNIVHPGRAHLQVKIINGENL